MKPKARDLFCATVLMCVWQTSLAILKAALPRKAGGQGGLFITFLLAALIIKDHFSQDNFLNGRGQRFTNSTHFLSLLLINLFGGVEAGILKTWLKDTSLWAEVTWLHLYAIPACGLGKGEFYAIKCTFLHRIIGTFRLEEISKIIESNHKPSTTLFTTKPWPLMPYLECLAVLLGGNCSCRNHSLWGVKSAVLVLDKLHLWEHPGSLYSLEVLLGTLLTWFNSSHRMRVAVGATFLLSLLCPSSPLLSSTGSDWWSGLSPLVW